jgi:D-alanyl-D-alanine carboxypeptidase
LQRDFPEYYPYFGTLAFTYGKRTVKTHNRLLGKYEGADGIRTGYIAASGFNLTTSARREDKRLVGVVMGGKSAAARNAYMAKMLDRNFPKCVGGSTIAALVGPAKGAVEAPAPEAAEPVDAAALSDLAAGSGKEAAGTTIKAVTADKTSPKSAGEPAAVEAPVDAPAGSKDVPVAADTQPADGTAQPPVQNAAVAAIPPDGSWHIQIGSYDRKEDATERVQKLRAEGPAELRGKPAFMVTVQKGTDITYKARFSGFTRKAARATCRQIHRQKLSCYVLAPKS